MSYADHDNVLTFQMEVLTLAVEVATLMAAARKDPVFLIMGPASVTRYVMTLETAVMTFGLYSLLPFW